MKTLEEFKRKFDDYDISYYFEKTSPYAKNVIKIDYQLQADIKIPKGTSKLGGKPDLPKGMRWVRNKNNQKPLSFVAQINFAEIHAYDLDHQLPDHGILYLFYDFNADALPWGYDPKDNAEFQVIYHDGSNEELIRKEPPIDMKVDGLFKSAVLSYTTELELPDYNSDFRYIAELNEEQYDRYYDLRNEIRQLPFKNKLLGHSDCLLRGMELQCELVRRGINAKRYKLYESDDKQSILDEIPKWQCVLQIVTNEDLGMLWGDEGIIFVWMKDEDLKQRNFEHSWVILENELGYATPKVIVEDPSLKKNKRGFFQLIDNK